MGTVIVGVAGGGQPSLVYIGGAGRGPLLWSVPLGNAMALWT